MCEIQKAPLSEFPSGPLTSGNLAKPDLLALPPTAITLYPRLALLFWKHWDKFSGFYGEKSGLLAISPALPLVLLQVFIILLTVHASH